MYVYGDPNSTLNKLRAKAWKLGVALLYVWMAAALLFAIG